MPRLILLAIALLVASAALAQTPKPPIDLDPVRQRVKQLLNSPLPRDQAWGAFLAGDLNLDELAPNLIGFIEREGGRGFDGEREFALRAAVDSMIRLNISPPVGLLEPFFETISYETIILFSQKPREYAGNLLKLAQSATRPSERFALLNLVVDTRPPGAAAWLLENLEIEATLHITDPHAGPGVPGGSVGGVSGGGCVRLLGVPQDYPPLGVYTLSPEAWNGRVILTGRAPNPMYYFRREVISGDTNLLHCEFESPLTANDRLEYIARLAGRSSQSLQLKAVYTGRVVPADGEDVQLAAAKLRAEIEADYYSVLAPLRGRNTLTLSEAAGLRPQINLTVLDQR